MAMTRVDRLMESSSGGREDLPLAPLFKAYGRFCASHASEIVVSTFLVGIGVGSIAARRYGMPQKTAEGVCDAGACDEVLNLEVVTADVVLSAILRCIAVLYLYVQFSNFNRLGSKYMLGLAVSFAISFSFLIAATVVQIFNVTVLRAVDAMPVFILLIDLSRAVRLAKYALRAKNQEDLCSRIGSGLAVVGPSLALDTLVEVMIIAVGTYARPPLQSVCFFGCVSLAASFVLFVTFFPAALALAHELSSEAPQASKVESGPAVLSLHHLASFLAEEEDCKANPIAQSIKLVMSFGLGFVHIFNWIVRPLNGNPSSMSALLDSSRSMLQPATERLPVISTDSHSLPQLMGLTVDEWLPLALGCMLLLKYVLWDPSPEPERSSGRCRSSVFELWPASRSNSSQTVALSKSTVESAPLLTAADNCDGAVTSNIQGSHAQAKPELQQQPTELAKRRGVEALAPLKQPAAVVEDEEAPVFCIGSASPQSSLSSSASSDGDDKQTFEASSKPAAPRTLDECLNIKTELGAEHLLDEEVLMLVEQRKMAAYRLETELGDYERAVRIRRMMVSPKLASQDSLELLPYSTYNYNQVQGACCENVIGYMPVPVGVAGPLLMDGQLYHVPMATTEGCLVASTNRGCRALQKSDGVRSTITGDSMTRAPALRLPSAQRAGAVKLWLEEPDNFDLVKKEFDSTSSYGRLQKLHCIQAGCTLFVRFAARTGDAMGMNMVSKGVEKSVRFLRDRFNDLEVLSLSGNVCTDKKPSAINWVMGRGKSVVCEATLPAAVVKEVLKTNALSLVELNRQKNLVGSAMAGSIGGFNAHAANIVAAVFIATGQDAAQSGTSSTCLTQMEVCGPRDEDLYITCTMPSIETGTVGGGTVLSPQAACLKMLGVQGAHRQSPGQNASTLARVICSTVLAGELSLMAALASGDLVKSHMRHNRSSASLSIPPPIAETTSSNESVGNDTGRTCAT